MPPITSNSHPAAGNANIAKPTQQISAEYLPLKRSISSKRFADSVKENITPSSGKLVSRLRDLPDCVREKSGAGQIISVF